MEELEALTAAYYANKDYDVDNSVAKAKLFRVAVRGLLGMRPTSAMRGAGGNQQTFAFNLDGLVKVLNSVEAWLAVNDTGSTGNATVIHPDFSFSRD